MTVDMKQYLLEYISENAVFENPEALVLPNITLDPKKIKVMMINEVSPKNPADDFYGSGNKNDSVKDNGINSSDGSCSCIPDYMITTKSLFQNAGIQIESVDDLIRLGIYVTNAVKIPKTEYTIETQTILNHVPVLEKEFDLFPNLKAVMLMGDVAKKAFNAVAKKKTKKPVIPSGSTYKLRKEEFYYGSIRVFPSYIMTGGNILIEKSKAEMIADDLQQMKALL